MNVLTLTTPDIENGLGCRVTIWIAGCNRHCPGCHNSHTWNYDQGKSLFDPDVLNKIENEVEKDYIQGITLSGGDPLDQSDDSLTKLYIFLYEFHLKYGDTKDVWMYTGAIFEDLLKKQKYIDILKYVDVLVDGPFIQSKKELDLPFKGSTNQRIIDVKKSLKLNKTILYNEENGF